MKMKRTGLAGWIAGAVLCTLWMCAPAAAVSSIDLSPIVYSGQNSDIEISAIRYEGSESNVTVSAIRYPDPKALRFNPDSLAPRSGGEASDPGALRGRRFQVADNGVNPSQVFGKRNLVTNAFSILSPKEGGSYLKTVTIKVILPKRARLHFRLAKKGPGGSWNTEWNLFQVEGSELVDKDGYFQWEKVFNLEPTEYYLIGRTNDLSIPIADSAKDKISFTVKPIAVPPNMTLSKKTAVTGSSHSLVPDRNVPVMPGKKSAAGAAALGAQDPQVKKADQVALSRKPMIIVKSIGFKPAPLTEGGSVDLLIEFQNAGTGTAASGLPYTVSCRVKSGGPCPIASSSRTIGEALAPGAGKWVTLAGSPGAKAGSYEVTVEPKPGTKKTAPFSVKGKVRVPVGRELAPVAPEEEDRPPVRIQRRQLQ